MSLKTDKWLDSITKDHGVGKKTILGIEIVGRILILDDSDYNAIEEVLGKIREIGSAEIVQQIELG